MHCPVPSAVLQGLDYLHHHKVVHGDLKPANLLQDSNSARVKIADFGSSSILAGSDKLLFSMRNCPGFSTPAFRSPESLTSGYTPSYEMDLWALGVCVYIWVYGVLPFTGGAPFIIYEKIRGQDVVQPSNADVSGWVAAGVVCARTTWVVAAVSCIMRR
jgi:serine/threonine protein kinase